MILTSDVAMAMLVALLGLIAMVVAMRIRRGEQHRPQLSPVAVAVVQKADMRAPSRATWSAIPAKAVVEPRSVVTRQDEWLAPVLTIPAPAPHFAARAEDISADHRDEVQYL